MIVLLPSAKFNLKYVVTMKNKGMKDMTIPRSYAPMLEF